jgi:hypothetical protein
MPWWLLPLGAPLERASAPYVFGKKPRRGNAQEARSFARRQDADSQSEGPKCIRR